MKRGQTTNKTLRAVPGGVVTLVGAGPGSADQLTLGALKALQRADVILYDALLAADVVELFPRRAKAVYVGKRCGQHALKQEQINHLLVSYGKQGMNVVRLKGGDPFIFGRGADEVQALREAGLAYSVIPGVSALNGVAALVGLPLTVRHRSNELRAIQGHHLPAEESYWLELARYQGTLVIFMGMENLPVIFRRLVAAGMPEETPYAVVETVGGEHAVTRGALADVLDAGFKRQTTGPGIIYMGPNVEFMAEGSGPLAGTVEEGARVAAFTRFS